MISIYIFLLFLVVHGQAKICQDSAQHRSNCQSWKRQNFCQSRNNYFGFMKENCPKTCTFCREQRGSGCADKVNTCHGFKRYCPPSTEFIAYMKLNCQKTCGLCRGTEVTRPQVKARWTVWRNGMCSKTCGQGTRIRTRVCRQLGRPSTLCTGRSQDRRTCNKGPCPATASCKDNDDHKASCLSWKTSGYCLSSSRFSDFMKNNCQKTCGLCLTRPRPGVSFGECGTGPHKKGGRVIGGVDAEPNSWPWQVGLKDGLFKCGGTLIHQQWVVTAAHCTYGKGYVENPDYLTIVIGDHDRRKIEPTEFEMEPSKVINHQAYVKKTVVNDIALIKLKKPVTLKKGVGLACRPKQGVDIAVSTTCWITGWGLVNQEDRAAILQEAKMPVVSNGVCSRKLNYYRSLQITKGMVCAGIGRGSKISGCFGDSGGPFVCKNPQTKKWYLEGIVSWGSHKCQASHKYTVFTRVSEYRDWIDETIRQNQD